MKMHQEASGEDSVYIATAGQLRKGMGGPKQQQQQQQQEEASNGRQQAQILDGATVS
jgi:hypothetical protein